MTETFSVTSENQAPSNFPKPKRTVDPYFRAVRTLAREARTAENQTGSTPEQRTAARFVLLDMMAFGELHPEQRKYVYGAFEHAYRHNDIAPSLQAAIERDYTPLDFSKKYEPSKTSASESAPKRAAAEAKRAKRRAEDSRKALLKKGSGGHTSNGDSKKGRGKGKGKGR